MVFSSIPFLYYFLPVAMALYFLVPAKGRNGVLFLESLVFYAWGDARYVPMLLFDVAQGYACARLICWHRTSSWPEKNRMRWKKCWLAVSVLCALGMLGYYKYADFFLENWNRMTGGNVRLLQLVLPAGISFYTFQIISYTVDVYRGTTAVQRRFVDLAAYICMFPQLIAGPIVRYETIAAQLAGRTCSVDQAAAGVRRLILGLSKKVLLADSLGLLVTTFRQSEKTVLFYWIYAIAFTLQIYFDFSGYSDMAVGMGQMLGFSFPDNFRYPVHFKKHHGILAAVAYFPGPVVPGLCVYSPGRQSKGPGAAAAGHCRRVAGYRPVARGGLEFCAVGRSVCPVVADGKMVHRAAACKEPSVLSCLCTVFRGGGLCAY